HPSRTPARAHAAGSSVADILSAALSWSATTIALQPPSVKIGAVSRHGARRRCYTAAFRPTSQVLKQRSPTGGRRWQCTFFRRLQHLWREVGLARRSEAFSGTERVVANLALLTTLFFEPSRQAVRALESRHEDRRMAGLASLGAPLVVVH